jgi:hypothetical protein
MTPSPPSIDLIIGAISLFVLIGWVWKMVDVFLPEDRPSQDGTNLGE